MIDGADKIFGTNNFSLGVNDWGVEESSGWKMNDHLTIIDTISCYTENIYVVFSRSTLDYSQSMRRKFGRQPIE